MKKDVSTTILRPSAVTKKMGFSRSSLYLLISNRLWPKQVSIGPRMAGWPEYEVDAMIAARIAGKSEDEIKKLVLSLEKARSRAA